MSDFFPTDFFPIPPSGGIGQVGIGQMPIGPQRWDWRVTIISQYANSPIILNLLNNFSEAVDQNGLIDQFWDLIWNVDTAQGYGLDVWGRIVVIGRTIPIPTKYFGFDEMGPLYIEPFGPGGVGPFYAGEALTSNFVMSDDVYRQVILAKALANINGGTTATLNKVLQLLFPGRGNCYVVDNFDMTMTYRFEFPTTAVEKAIVTATNVFQHPAGVAVGYFFA